MKSLIALGLILGSFSTSFASINDFDKLSNKSNRAIKAIVILSEGGLPRAIAFSKAGHVVTYATVKENNDVIDINEGELYDVAGPQVEGDICAMNAKLKLSSNGFEISYDVNSVGREFLRYCTDLISLQGSYRK
jgi:hypothetical protein